MKVEGSGFSGSDPFALLRRVHFEENGGHALLSPDNAICFAWLEGALQRLRPEGHTKVVSYLEAVLEEVLFEMKVTPPS